MTGLATPESVLESLQEALAVCEMVNVATCLIGVRQGVRRDAAAAVRCLAHAARAVQAALRQQRIVCHPKTFKEKADRPGLMTVPGRNIAPLVRAPPWRRIGGLALFGHGKIVCTATVAAIVLVIAH